MEMPDVADHSGMTGVPAGIFKPKSQQELCTFLSDNTGRKIRIGAGLTGVSGGAVPDNNEIFLDLSGLKRMEWYDCDSGILKAEAGVTMEVLDAFIQKEGWSLPVIPGSKEQATVGGMIACNGGGPLSLRFGKISAFLLGVYVILPNGTKVFYGSYANKVSEGISWKNIWPGSEGTMGIIAEAIFRCQPPLPELHYRRFSADDFFALLKLVPEMLRKYPYVMEVADMESLRFSSGKKEHVMWAAFSEAQEFDLPAGIRCLTVDAEHLNERFSIGYGLQHYKPFVDLDVSFPVRQMVTALESIKDWLAAKKFENIIFGHAGDGNFHIHLFFNNDQSEWLSVQNEFDEIISSNQGHISGEHGIGKLHSERFRRRMGKDQAELYRAAKRVLDPLNQLPSLC